MTVTSGQIFDALEATWPPAGTYRLGPWKMRRGEGGGKRVSAASAEASVTPADIDAAEAAMRSSGQVPLFVLYGENDPLDPLLAGRGYKQIDATVALAASVASLTTCPVPPVTAFEVWEPLAIMKEIWTRGGVDNARFAVMHRAKTKTGILARAKDKPAGVGFVALHENIAMVHAVEVLPQHRRQGVASWIMRAAAFWAQEQGADILSVLCVRANAPALALYSALGFEPCCGYHYRIAEA